VLGDGLLVEKHSRLPAGAGLVGVGRVRAHVGPVEPRPVGGKELRHPGGDAIVLGLLEVAPADPRLVGHDDDRNVRRIELGDRPCGTGQQLDAGRIAQVMPVGDECAVAIEKHRGDSRSPRRTVRGHWRTAPSA
jgi:hypothetical protein